MRLCTKFGAVYSCSRLDDVCLYYWVTHVLSVCTIYYWSGTSRSVRWRKNSVISVVELWYHELVMNSAQVVCQLCCVKTG